jgi:DNA-binding response OmpR family regulator
MSTNNNLLTILAVDDSAVIQGRIKQMLGGDYRVLVADNAVDALSTICHEPVKLLLLDVSMPGINGLELCRTIRSLEQFNGLPIIMLTAKDGAFDRVQGRLAGATEYLTKPFEAPVLLETIGKFLNKPVS